MDEATDNNNDAHLISYIRFIDGNNIVEDLLFCKNITASAKAQDLFEILDTFISESSFEWTKCVLMVLVLCAAVMEDRRLLFQAKPLKHFGPTALFIAKHSRQNI
jgi:hypothetical protein